MKKLPLDKDPEKEYSERVFEKLQLKGARLESKTFYDCVFRGCYLNCVLTDCNFLGLPLAGTVMKDCLAKEADFREADLSGADLSGTDLAGALFGSTNLSKADLRGARNYAINLRENKTADARFSLPEAMALLYCLGVKLD